MTHIFVLCHNGLNHIPMLTFCQFITEDKNSSVILIKCKIFFKKMHLKMPSANVSHFVEAELVNCDLLSCMLSLKQLYGISPRGLLCTFYTSTSGPGAVHMCWLRWLSCSEENVGGCQCDSQNDSVTVKMYWTLAKILLLTDVDGYSFANAVMQKYGQNTLCWCTLDINYFQE